MTRVTRRELLVALAGATGLAGCGSRGPASPTEQSPSPRSTSTDSPTPTDAPTPTESATPTLSPVEASELEFVGSVVRQPSESAPGQVRASLTNRTGETLTLLGGHLIPVSGGVADGPDDSLLLFPDQSDRINEYSWNETGSGDVPGGLASIDDATYDDCWRAPGGGLIRTDLADAAEIPDGLTDEADFYPLAAAGADCPEGRYTVLEELTVRATEQTLRTELTVDIDAGGRLAASGSLTVSEN